MSTNHRAGVMTQCAGPPIVPAAFCADCTAARRLSRLDHPAADVGDWVQVEPSAPSLSPATEAAVDYRHRHEEASDGCAGPTAFCLQRRPSSPPPPPAVTARCYRYIASSSSAYRQCRGSAPGGRGTRSYFRSLVPGGDAAFPVPPPAYDDS